MPKELNVPDRGAHREITVEEASHCPKCKSVGVLDKGHIRPHIDETGKKWDVVSYYCDNEGCSWYGTGWVVSSDDRGVVYQREQGTRGQDKAFEPMSPDQISFGRRVLEDVINADAESVKELNADPERPPDGRSN